MLQVALPQLQRLTCLVLASSVLDQPVVAAAAGIPSLRWLYASAEWAVLPPGPWQHNLRWLALSYRAMLASIEEIAAASLLEHVCVLNVSIVCCCAGWWRAARAATPRCRLSPAGGIPPHPAPVCHASEAAQVGARLTPHPLRTPLHTLAHCRCQTVRSAQRKRWRGMRCGAGLRRPPPCTASRLMCGPTSPSPAA